MSNNPTSTKAIKPAPAPASPMLALAVKLNTIAKEIDDAARHSPETTVIAEIIEGVRAQAAALWTQAGYDALDTNASIADPYPERPIKPRPAKVYATLTVGDETWEFVKQDISGLLLVVEDEHRIYMSNDGSCDDIAIEQFWGRVIVGTK